MIQKGKDMNNHTNGLTNEQVLAINKKERIGQESTSKSGRKMTIIDYINSKNITIQFEDGLVLTGKSYSDFLKHKINYPGDRTNRFTNRIGEEKYNNQGHKMTIINYRNASDIDIAFDDGTVFTHKTYRSFTNGRIKYPIIKKQTAHKLSRQNLYRKSVIGETNIAKNGLLMTVIACRNHRDIDIEFEDGTIVYNKRMQHFRTGEIAHPNKPNSSNGNQKENRIGEQSLIQNEFLATIIEYRNRDDIDIQFENGFIKKHCSYIGFKNGNVSLNDYNAFIRTHEIHTNKQGLKAKIVAYRKATDIDIQFEDGTIVNTDYISFKKGRVKNPNIASEISIGDNIEVGDGEIVTVKNIKTNKNITVEFSDGTVMTNVDATSLRNHTLQKKEQHLIGKTNMTNLGQKMTIIDDSKRSNLTIQFEDGTIVHNISYTRFLHGEVGNPNYSLLDKHKNQYIGKEFYVNKGQKVKVIDYVKSTDIKIQFETGCVVKTNSTALKQHKPSHPFPFEYKDIILDKLAYVYKETANYQYSCPICQTVDIDSFNNIKNHIHREKDDYNES